MQDFPSIKITRLENGWLISPSEVETAYRIRAKCVAETQESLLSQIKALTDDVQDIAIGAKVSS